MQADAFPAVSEAPEQDPVPRAALRQLVAAGSLRLVLQFADTREYFDQIGALTRLPGAPAWLLGIFASDGMAVPLVDLAAWAQRSEPAPWTVSSDTARVIHESAPKAKEALRALRFGEGASAWAIRLSQAPSIFDPTRSAAQPVSSRLPLAVSSVNGRLMEHAEQAWSLGQNKVALQVRWQKVYAELLQELSGAGAAGAARNV